MSTEFATQPIEIHAEFADILRQEAVRYEHPNQSALPRLVNGKFDQLVVQSGLKTSPRAWLMLSVFCAAVLGAIAFLLTQSRIPTGILATMGVLVPIVIANHLRENRQSALMEQLPDAIDRLGRLAQTGRNLASSLEHAAVDTPQPLRQELDWMSQQLKAGSDVEATLSGFSSRSGIAATSMLSGVLKVHTETGSELSGPLFSLSDDVRDQLVQRERDRAVSMEGQWPAGALIILPLVLSLIFLGNESAAFSTVLDSVVGRVALCGAAVLWCLGSIVILRIVRQVSR